MREQSDERDEQAQTSEKVAEEGREIEAFRVPEPFREFVEVNGVANAEQQRRVPEHEPGMSRFQSRPSAERHDLSNWVVQSVLGTIAVFADLSRDAIGFRAADVQRVFAR
jgi:hypothetical protein